MKEEGNTRTALFVGSFDPFTIGHADIVERTLKLFGRVVIGVGINPEKHCMMTAEERIEAVRSLYEGDNRVKIVGFTDLAVDLAQREGAAFIVKGVRSSRQSSTVAWLASKPYCCMPTPRWQPYRPRPCGS